ncbi:MAG TPA: DUF2017 family protein [Galbitalea sp.]
MKRPKATPNGIRLVFTRVEADLLSSVADQLVDLLGEADDHVGDAALERLLPDGYRGSAEDADEFRRFTQTELVDEKVAGAQAIVAGLASRAESGDAALMLSKEQATRWLRSINDIRLALASRLGIVDETFRPTPGDDNFAIYSWLGMVQWSLLRAVDR